MAAQLTERYRPQRMSEFVGLDKPKRIFASFARDPHKAAFLFVGPSGTGKTTFARALANEIDAEILHIRSQECSIDRLKETERYWEHPPMSGKRFWLVLIDEVDTASNAALNWLLTTLDELPAQTVFVFTANQTDKLEDRWLSRSERIDFSSYGIAKEAVGLLERVWKSEAPGTAAPNLARLVKEQNNNVRASLMALQTELRCA